jgi:hypothetical protein
MAKKTALLACLIAVILIAAIAVLLSLHQSPLLNISGPLIRENQTVVVNGVMEMWQLQWRKPPEPWCDILDGPWETAPCQGFTYGEAGELDLVRYRNSHEYERLHLTPLSTSFPEHGAVVQRWPGQSDDLDHGVPLLNSPEMKALTARVRSRPIVKIMSFADYNHDGNATEFFFQTEAGAAHRWGIVVGISPTNPHLHAFGTARHPNVPLVLQPKEWEALRTAKGPVRVMDWKCPDHGATTDTERELEATPKGISVISREYAECGKEPRQLIHEEYK